MNNGFKCIIVDDEQDSIDLLIARLQLLFNNITISGAYLKWQEALQALRSQEADLVFMDISMPEKDGLELLKLVPETDAEIIFITAHEEYALSAFRAAAAGYILKPIDDVELSATVHKAIERLQHKRMAKQHQANIQSVKIGIPNNKGIDYINMQDIQYFETIHGYTKVVTKDADILSSFSIGKFKALIDSDHFYQVHRSYIVNLNYICRYKSTGELVMQNNKEIPVSKNFRDDFLGVFNTLSNK
jgi:two-component system LytT family response regulator